MSERKSALIIANWEYEDKSLRKLVAPAKDAEFLARVLENQSIGGFEVTTALNDSSHEARRKIEGFFNNRGPDEIVLLYFSGHGMKDEEGHLYFASPNTSRDLLQSTSIESTFVKTVMSQSYSKKQILILDCCYAGAFTRGINPKADRHISTRVRFGGHGRVILAASDSTQYSFEGEKLDGKAAPPSIFTRIMVEGLETGDADLNDDGLISVDELYNYVHKRMTEESPHQTPKQWAEVEGNLYIAQTKGWEERQACARERTTQEAALRALRGAPVAPTSTNWSILKRSGARIKSWLSPGPPRAAIDLGTRNTRIYVKGEGIVLNEPSVVAINRSTSQVQAIGNDAVGLELVSSNTVLLHPLAEGVIVDPDLATEMLRYFLAKVRYRTVFGAIFAVPARTTKANLSVLCNVAKAAQLTHVSCLEKCLLAASGAGLPFTEPGGNMVVDIGGGTVDVAVVSCGGLVYSSSHQAAGNQMDEAIMIYLKRKYSFLVSPGVAEQIKAEVGSAHPLDRPRTMEVKGRNLIEMIPKMLCVDDGEIHVAISECVSAIMNAVRIALERTPPELSADISDRGIVLTGGGALLTNWDKRICEETGLSVLIADDPLSCVALGGGRLLNTWKIVERSRL